MYYYYYLNIQSYYIFFILQQLYRLILGMGKFNFNNLLLTLAGAHDSVARNNRLEFERTRQEQQQLNEMQHMGDAFADIQGESNPPITNTTRMQFAKGANIRGQQSGDVFGGKSRRRHCRCRSGTCRSKSRHCRRSRRTCRSKSRHCRRTYRRH